MKWPILMTFLQRSRGQSGPNAVSRVGKASKEEKPRVLQASLQLFVLSPYRNVLRQEYVICLDAQVKI